MVVSACTDRLPDQDLRIVDAVPVERLSAAVLWQDFNADREQAERIYKGKAVVVNGSVTRAGAGAPGDRYVYFGQSEVAGVHASLLDEQAESILASVKESPRITLKCFCEGMASDVVLKSCVAERWGAAE